MVLDAPTRDLFVLVASVRDGCIIDNKTFIMLRSSSPQLLRPSCIADSISAAYSSVRTQILVRGSIQELHPISSSHFCSASPFNLRLMKKAFINRSQRSSASHREQRVRFPIVMYRDVRCRGLSTSDLNKCVYSRWNGVD